MTLPPTADPGGQPFYFDAEGARLFGCFHPAARHPSRAAGVLLCGPWAHEYMASHRALRQLALKLARCGWPVQRFDWFGSGDSAGASDAGTPSRWLVDLTAARATLARRASTSTVVLCGLRLGASLALRHLEDAGPVAALVLWDPVVSGSAWADAITSLASGDDPSRREGDVIEVAGVSLTPTVRTELDGLDARRITRAPASRVLVVDGPVPSDDTAALVRHLESLGAAVERRAPIYPPNWLEPGSSVVPGAVVQAISAWLDSAL